MIKQAMMPRLEVGTFYDMKLRIEIVLRYLLKNIGQVYGTLLQENVSSSKARTGHGPRRRILNDPVRFA